MKIKNIVKASLISLLLSTSASAFAGIHNGIITNNYLNSDYYGRGVCFKMFPAVGGNNWFCLYKSNALYSEFATLLLSALEDGKKCDVRWNSQDSNGNKIIHYMNCNK